MNPDIEEARKRHWQQVYKTKDARLVGWYAPRLETSLAYISRYAAPDTPVYDIGGGASTLADDLLEAGYKNITVLDISEAALLVAQKRLGAAAGNINWITGDIIRLALPPQSCALWHDRAVFHFLADEQDKKRYVTAMEHALRPGGHIIIATFGPDGPKECSGLPTVRYDANALAETFGQNFALCESQFATHATPFQTKQQFQYACFKRI